MIQEAFNELVYEARLGEVKLQDERVFRINFNIVDDIILKDMPNMYIKNKENFYYLLNIYVEYALNFYQLERNFYNVKKILMFLFINITSKEMNNLEEYIIKYINFITDKKLIGLSGEKKTTLGNLNYEVKAQSIQQETPYCFKSCFMNGESEYMLPIISFGIKNNECYIYAIQNKKVNINDDSSYNLEVKNKLRTINSSISKYRNVTPSFVVALALFISFLNENDIKRIKVVTPLPIRQKNRELSNKYKINFYSMEGSLSEPEIEKLKKELEDKRLNDEYNSTVKFVNCFNRLKLHFDNLYLNNNLDEEKTLEIINLITKNSFLEEVVREKER